MFWKYTRFEMKLCIMNRKNWFVAAFLLLFYLLFFMYYSQVEPSSLKDQKAAETQLMLATFEYVDPLREDSPEIAEIYDVLTELYSQLNMQYFYIGSGSDSEMYIETGFAVNKLRLKLHEMGNTGIPDHAIYPKSEILKENALLKFAQKHQLPIEKNSFDTNHYFVNAMQMMSGLLFLVILLIIGSELLVYEQRHQTIFQGLPLSFIHKVASKVFIHFIWIFIFLLAGFSIGRFYADRKLAAGDFSFPILLYQKGEFIAVSTQQYVIYLFLGLALVAILLLVLSILLNMLFQHAFANIIVGLVLFYLPDIVWATGLKGTFLQPIKYIDIASVLSGDLATQLGNERIDFLHAMIWLGSITIGLIICVYVFHMRDYLRKPKSVSVEKAL